MYELEKTFHFEAGHVLEYHDGKCREPHGHSYTLTVKIRSNTLIASGPKMNMVQDFSDISAIVKPMIEAHLDHKWLNDSLNTKTPTTEVIVKWIYDYLEPRLPLLYSICISETASSKVTYTRS